MKYLGQIHNEYEDYVEDMQSKGGFHTYSFEEWINWQQQLGYLTQQEYNQCYDKEGYLKEPQFRCDHD